MQESMRTNIPLDCAFDVWVENVCVAVPAPDLRAPPEVTEGKETKAGDEALLAATKKTDRKMAVRTPIR